jgi:DNA-binding PadR family transcriptional regulator
MHPFHAFHAFHHRFHREDGPPEDFRRGHGRHRDHGPGHGRGEGDRRDGRRNRSDLGRFFAHGDLKLVILNLIAEKPRHGYEIIKAIEDAVGGAYSPSPGVVYPTLTLLEELGYTAVTPGEGTKKLHGITPEGRAMLEANRPTLDALLARMAEASAAFGDGPHPSVVRAKEGLKLALKMRFARGPLTADQSAAVAAALDAATAAIERS